MGTKTPVVTPKKAPKKKAPSSAGHGPPLKILDATNHKGESRLNIPTRETAGFAADDVDAPKSVLYPRDPSLDPQLVWKGKDEQDRNSLEVPAIPIYIQEKIHPLALIEDLRARAAAGKERQPDLFADFNGLDDFAKKVDFYHHDQHWTNRMILGDSLLVMTSLAEKERLKGRVQMIYLDPPYGIKFPSNWQVSTRKRDVKDAKAEDATRQPEQIKAFRDTWQFGIHSYLPYLRDRLVVARDLLTESGSVFVQIGDENVHLVRCLLDEVFGSENFVSSITFRKTAGATSEYLPPTADHLLWYGKMRERLKYRPLYLNKGLAEGGAGAYDQIELFNGTRRRLSPEEREDSELAATNGRVFRHQILTSPRIREARTGYYPVRFNGNDFLPTSGEWKTHRNGMERLIAAKRVAATGKSLAYIRFIEDFPAYPLSNVWDDTQSGSGMDKVYVVQTNSKIVERCLLMTTDPGDLALDPTCGSGTTAYVAEQWGRRWITIDTSRVALALARTRLMAAKFPYYLLADSPDGRKKEVEILAAPATFAAGPPCTNDIRRGFVYKRVPHVTLKCIANNPDIKEGMTRDKIDAAIRKHTETEILYDQPYPDNRVVRVTGPFTVESLSPHRMLPTGGEGAPDQEVNIPRSADNYLTIILDNLRKAGVQNTVKNERLVFERLDAFPGEYVQAEGTFTESGASKGVRVSVGPEFGTVTPEWIKCAAKEAIKGSACDLLLVCGFAFDPHVHEQTQELKKEILFGKLRILAVRMNPDLAMGDELLKKTGSGNLFMIFGEPDLDIKKQKDGQMVVELRGVDVYDPTTGEVRSHSTDDVACWLIDTDYNGESFFVRHAYFCGGGEPYEKLKKALRADIDEAEWAKLYATTSLPFDAPKKGKIAVKVINHYGDEVLKVYTLGK
jgi:adenine-specific DNA-methyltransferase